MRDIFTRWVDKLWGRSWVLREVELECGSWFDRSRSRTPEKGKKSTLLLFGLWPKTTQGQQLSHSGRAHAYGAKLLRLWVWIPLGAGFFLLSYQYCILNSGPSRRCNTIDFLLKICSVVQLEAKHLLKLNKKVSGQMFVELLWISIVEMKTRRHDFFPNTTFPLGLIPGNRHTN